MAHKSLFKAVSFIDNKFTPHSIELLNKKGEVIELFTIGDHVTNDMGMRGDIVSFELSDDTLFVYTTWSGIGTNIESIRKVLMLPSDFQVSDQVCFSPTKEVNIECTILAVHFYGKYIKYDLEALLGFENGVPLVPIKSRFYNIDSKLVMERDYGYKVE